MTAADLGTGVCNAGRQISPCTARLNTGRYASASALLLEVTPPSLAHAEFSKYCLLQAVDRARQRQKEEEKARDRLLPGSGPAPSPRAEDIDDNQAIETEAAKV